MTHPYRAAVIAAPRRGVDSTAASVFPLAALALAFVLPVTSLFGGEIVISPIGVAFRAWRRAFGERRLALLLDAFALASVSLVVLNFEVAHRAGAWLFVGAWVVLGGIRVRSALA